MELIEILTNTKNPEELKRRLGSLENYSLTPEKLKKIDQELLKNLERGQVLDILIAISEWYCSHNSYEEDWKKIKSELLKDKELSPATRDYLAVLD